MNTNIITNGLGLWLDASESSSITFNGNSISEWRDLSGNGRHFFQENSDYQPDGTRTQNGLRVIDFNGTQWMQGNTASLNVARNVDGLTIIVVQKTDSTLDGMNGGIIIRISISSSANRSRAGLFSITSNFAASGQKSFEALGRRLDSVMPHGPGASFPFNSSANVISSVFDYGNAEARIYENRILKNTNSSFHTPGFTDDTDSAAIRLGISENETLAFDGFLAEILIYNRVLSDNERIQLESYLLNKWNLQEQPSPFKINKSSVELFKIKSKKTHYYIPTEDEWYKAAYYDPTLNNGSGGYWNYATRSDAPPTPVTANSIGDGSAGSSGNFANFNNEAVWNGAAGNTTSVGTNGSSSYYGTFDQSGNAYEWSDAIIPLSEVDSTTGQPQTDLNRGLRGGYWLTLLNNDEFRLSTTGRNSRDPSTSNSSTGFRITCKNNILNLPDFVNVNDINNPNDATGYGSVSYSYNIGKYEVTNSEYALFLNSVAITDNYGLYDTNMGSDIRGGISRSGSSGSFVYSVKNNMGNKPVIYVTWFNAARYCNWLTNGKPSGLQTKDTTESGSYNLYSKTSGIVKKGNFRVKT